MLRTLLILTGCFALTGSTVAGVISRDWVTVGDGLLTYDTLSGLEWLDPPVTSQLGPNVYENTYAAIRPGGALEGFRIATREEFRGLAASAGVNITTSDYATNSEPALALRSLLIFPLYPPDSPDGLSLFYGGFLAGAVPGTVPPASPGELAPAQSRAIISVSRLGAPAAFVATNASSDLFNNREGVPVFLVRNVVPEPSAVALTVVCVAAAFAKKTRRALIPRLDQSTSRRG